MTKLLIDGEINVIFHHMGTHQIVNSATEGWIIDCLNRGVYIADFKIWEIIDITYRAPKRITKFRFEIKLTKDLIIWE